MWFKASFWGTLAVAAVAASALPASAAIIQITFSGTLDSGFDSGGFFFDTPHALDGQTVSVVYTVDTSRGIISDTSVNRNLKGGDFLGVSSPLSADLTINGKTEHFAGDFYSNNSVMFDGTGVGQSVNDKSALSSRFISTSYIYVPGGLADDVNIPYAIDYNNPNATGILQFYFRNAAGDTLTSGMLQRIATPAPEPATWAMMLAGLAGLGVLARRKRLRDHAAPIALR